MDKFFTGFLSGMIGGMAMDLWGFLLKDLLGIASRNYVDWTGVVIYGIMPETWNEFLFAFASHIVWTGFLGSGLAYLLPRLTLQGLRTKGALFGFLISFFIYALAILGRLPYFSKIPFATAATNALGGLLWGAITAHCLKYWLPDK